MADQTAMTKQFDVSRVQLQYVIEPAGYRRPARFGIWLGERLLAISNGEFRDMDLATYGRLFAAAPDLLAAVIRANDFRSMPSPEYAKKYPDDRGVREVDRVWEIITAAIAKAEGRQP